MQDIAAAMTVYLSKVQELPPSLTLLRPAAARVGLTLDFTCPVSHQPYIYNANGLTAPGDPHRLVLYDATPVHDGQYWAIMLLPAQATQPLQAEVIRLTPAMLQLYLKSADNPLPPLPASN